MAGASRLLLVEDNPGDAKLVEAHLAGVGGTWVITVVTRLAHALERLESERYEAALLDLQLPDASGLRGLEQLAAAHPGLPVVVLTGHADEALGLDAIRAGAEDYLVKGRSGGPEIARSLTFAVERRHELATLRLERDLIDGVLDGSPAAVVELRPDGVISRFNAEAEALTGWSAADAVGRSCFEVFARPDREPQTHALFRKALEEEARGVGEARLVTRHGDSRPVAWRWSRLEAEAVIAFGIDLSERRELEAQLRDAHGQAVLGRVVAGVAHEVRNPLFGLTALLDVLATEAPGAEWRRPLDRLHGPARRLAALTEELIGYAEGLAPDAPPAPASREAAAAAEAIRDEADSAGVALETDVDDTCPEVTGGEWLRHLLVSLLRHALRSCETGSTLRLAARARGGGGRDGLECRIALDGPAAGSETTAPWLAGISRALAERRVAEAGGSLEIGAGPVPELSLWVPSTERPAP